MVNSEYMPNRDVPEGDSTSRRAEGTGPFEGPSRSLPDRRESVRDREVLGAQRLSCALGWLSIGLGVVQIVAPDAVSRFAGVAVPRTLMRALGVREVATGLGLIGRRKPVGWLRSRVVGDAMDLAVLTTAGGPRSAALRRAAAAAAIAGVTAVDLLAERQFSEVADRIEDDDSMDLRETIVINGPPAEVYAFWRKFDNLPQVMSHLESVASTSDGRSHWIARGPARTRVEWDAELIDDRPDELIAWRSLPGSRLEHSGSVRFETAPGGRGTLVRLRLHYRMPGGVLGATAAKLLGHDPAVRLKNDLRRLKQMVETGEIITTEGQPAGRKWSRSWKYDDAARTLAAAF